jgi:hypothetical protein
MADVAARLGATPLQVALAWLLRRAPNILLIPGTSSVAHLRENLAAAECALPDDAIKELDCMANIRLRLTGCESRGQSDCFAMSSLVAYFRRSYAAFGAAINMELDAAFHDNGR